MTHPLDGSILRIFDSQKRAVGAGFLVAPGLALTCAHVVSRALLGTIKIPPEQPTGEVSLDFPLLNPGQELKAQVEHWSADGDVAVLVIPGELPAGATPAELIKGDEVWKHPCCAFGYPEGYDMGVWY